MPQPDRRRVTPPPPMLYLSRAQIQSLVDRIGQPEAAVLLHRFTVGYARHLDSRDVSDLYDQRFFDRIDEHPVHAVVDGRYTINAYNAYAFEYLKPRLAGARILEVGCGRGDFALALAWHGARRVVGLDLAETSIRAAQAKLAGSGLTNAAFYCQPASDLDTGEIFDFVVLNDVTEHLSDRELQALLRQIAPHLTRGSELVIHTPNGLSLSHETDRGWLPALYKLYLIVARGWRGVERSAEELYYEQTHINVKSFRQLKRLLQPFGYRSRVIYDRGRLRGIPGTEALSPNMLVLATLDAPPAAVPR